MSGNEGTNTITQTKAVFTKQPIQKQSDDDFLNLLHLCDQYAIDAK
jgi:hypothetical protein